jgi:lactoylglutathione lyase
MLNSVCVLTIKVSDIQKALEFYTEKLDFEVSKFYGDEIVSLKQEPIALILEKKEADNHTVGSNVVFAIQSYDIEKDYLALKEKGVKLLFNEPKPCPPGKFFAIEDPFGNQIEVLQFINSQGG